MCGLGQGPITEERQKEFVIKKKAGWCREGGWEESKGVEEEKRVMEEEEEEEEERDVLKSSLQFIA